MTAGRQRREGPLGVSSGMASTAWPRARLGFHSSSRNARITRSNCARVIARQLSHCAAAIDDRPGTGRSERRKEPLVLASTVADELDEVLARAFVPPPYILVGHSLGGLYVQAYARARGR